MGKKIEMTEDEFKKIVLILKCSKRYVNLPPNNLFLGNLWRVSSKLADKLLKRNGFQIVKEIEKAAYKFAESQNDGNAFTAYYKGFISGAQFKENTDNVSLNKNTIPPMTNSLGKHWVQPDPSGFVLDDDYVLMSKLDFDLLPDYTNSEPTGKYNGKMWKGQFNTTKGKKWFLAWCHDENEVSNLICISYREILVV